MDMEGLILDVTPADGDFDRSFLEKLGHPVLVCHGPEEGHTCPILLDGCEMVDRAHGIIFQIDLERPQHRAILKRYQEVVADDVPIVAATLWTEDPDRGAYELLKVAHSLEAEIKRVQGTLVIDDGARAALERGGKSLLPIGVTAVDGTFRAGDIVRVTAPDGAEFGRGVTNYSARDLRRIQGMRTAEIAEALELPLGTVKSRLNRARMELATGVRRRMQIRVVPPAAGAVEGPVS